MSQPPVGSSPLTSSPLDLAEHWDSKVDPAIVSDEQLSTASPGRLRAGPLFPLSPAEAGFLDDAGFHSTALGPGYDRPFQFDPSVREPKTIQLYRHLNLKSCVWTFDAYYDMTELIDVCGGSVTADFQVGTLGS